MIDKLKIFNYYDEIPLSAGGSIRIIHEHESWKWFFLRLLKWQVKSLR